MSKIPLGVILSMLPYAQHRPLSDTSRKIDAICKDFFEDEQYQQFKKNLEFLYVQLDACPKKQEAADQALIKLKNSLKKHYEN